MMMVISGLTARVLPVTLAGSTAIYLQWELFPRLFPRHIFTPHSYGISPNKWYAHFCRLSMPAVGEITARVAMMVEVSIET